MSKPKVIDLNKYERVNTPEELDGYQGLVIVPVKLGDGFQPPNIFFRKGIKKHNEIENTDGVEWFKDIRISKEGDDETYGQRVNWWFDQAILDDEYRKLINDNFNKHGFDIRKSWSMAQNYLKKFNYSARKTYLHKYVWNWLSNGLHQHLKFKK